MENVTEMAELSPTCLFGFWETDPCVSYSRVSYKQAWETFIAVAALIQN